jgi:hypothetical protein
VLDSCANFDDEATVSLAAWNEADCGIDRVVASFCRAEVGALLEVLDDLPSPLRPNFRIALRIEGIEAYLIVLLTI